MSRASRRSKSPLTRRRSVLQKRSRKSMYFKKTQTRKHTHTPVPGLNAVSQRASFCGDDGDRDDETINSESWTNRRRRQEVRAGIRCRTCIKTHIHTHTHIHTQHTQTGQLLVRQ